MAPHRQLLTAAQTSVQAEERKSKHHSIIAQPLNQVLAACTIAHSIPLAFLCKPIVFGMAVKLLWVKVINTTHKPLLTAPESSVHAEGKSNHCRSSAAPASCCSYHRTSITALTFCKAIVYGMALDP